MGQALNLPCTKSVGAAEMELAEDLLKDSTPDGYWLYKFYPVIRSGMKPHAWWCEFKRHDGVYICEDSFLIAEKKAFEETCPMGAEVGEICILGCPANRCILIPYLVNCECAPVDP